MSARVINVQVLLVSGDIQIIETLSPSMEKMAMHVEVCSDTSSATRKLCNTKYEAVVVDFHGRAEALELVTKLREMTSHQKAVVAAVLNNEGEAPNALRAGATFVLPRSLSPAFISRMLRAAYPLMVREKRRYYRCPLQIPVQISSRSHPDLVATSLNISEGGMAVSSAITLPVGQKVELHLKLPDTDLTEIMKAEVCWNDDKGSLGMEFRRLPPAVMERLQRWLAERLERSLPEETFLKG